ncbi:hypothetical protein MTBUT4_520001 [Magnetospirillum sp. UT-4]|nr:hypothetical protein MTBUT4_520001 [Magnetospirillum sp. UT-4]
MTEEKGGVFRTLLERDGIRSAHGVRRPNV